MGYLWISIKRLIMILLIIQSSSQSLNHYYMKLEVLKIVSIDPIYQGAVCRMQFVLLPHLKSTNF